MHASQRELKLLPMMPSGVTGNAPTDSAGIQIYRPFFLCGMATVLTVGCLLGAIALLGISRQQSYVASAWTPFVLAHANSQLFGWVGFFVIGFAMQQHGTTMAKMASFHRLAYAALGLMGLGIILRFLAEPLAQQDPLRWNWLGIFSGCLQILAIGLYVTNTTINRSPKYSKLTWPTAFIFASLGCLLVITLAEPWAFALSHQVSREASTAFVAEWFTPLRETQFLGFAALMIFGVAASKFPGCLGFQAAHKSWGMAAFGLWSSGLICRVVGWRTYYLSELVPGSDGLFRLGGILLLLGALCVIQALNVYLPVRHANPTQKFIRAAFGWLIVAGFLLAFEVAHLRAVGAPFSHAYTGGIRHAVTVGFISQMIVGVGYHLVTRMMMLDERVIPQLWSVSLLINLGNGARVTLEILTDYQTAAFMPMGWTGFVELLGLGIWAIVMVRFILRRGVSYAVAC